MNSSSSKGLRALEPRLNVYRRMAERGWSEETVHRTASPWDPTNSRSRGQCGVTSRWLQQLLRADDLPTTYCVGELREPSSTVAYHCWLEYGEAGSPDAWVIDLTGDQARGIDDEVVLGRRADLADQGIEYRVEQQPSEDELSRTSVVRRADRLAAAVGR